MNKNTSKVICTLAALCILIQAQPVYAEQITNATEIEAIETENPEETEIEEQPEIPESTEKPEMPEQPEEPKPQKPKDPIPKTVKGLRTTCQSDKKVLLQWNKSKGAVKYKVYRKKENSGYQLLKSVSSTNFTDKGVQYGKKYRYKVVPLNGDKKAGKAATIVLNNRQAVNITSQKYSYTQMTTDMKELKAQYNNYCEMEQIGKYESAFQKNKLVVLKIANAL